MVDSSTPQAALDHLYAAFGLESDFSIALGSAAVLEELLRRLLEARLLPCFAKDRDLLGREQPLSTFSARIVAAQQLGLVSTQLAKDLDLVRKVRNKFAHSFEALSLEDAPVRDQVAELRGRIPKAPQEPDGPERGAFTLITCAGRIAMELAAAIGKVQRLDEREPEPMYIDWNSVPAPLLEILDKLNRPGGTKEPISAEARAFLMQLIEENKKQEGPA